MCGFVIMLNEMVLVPLIKKCSFFKFIARLNIPYPAAFKLSERIEDLGIQVKKHS